MISPLTLAWMAISTSRFRSKRSFRASLAGAAACLEERPATCCPPEANEGEENLVAVSGADIVDEAGGFVPTRSAFIADAVPFCPLPCLLVLESKLFTECAAIRNLARPHDMLRPGLIS